MRVGDLVGEIAARDEALGALRAEVADLRRVVAGLDSERDALQVGGQLVGWLVGWLVVWLVGCLVGWLVGRELFV
jgi:hypothetical protein